MFFDHPASPRAARAIAILLLALLTLGLARAVPASGAPSLTTLYAFPRNSDQTSPDALVAGPDGNFYGTTFGPNQSGTVFKITPAGTLTTLYTFSPLNINNDTNSDGAHPNALVAGPDGNFYGSTESGGPNGSGTVFKITPAGTFTILHSFSLGNFNGMNSDGEGPNRLIAGPDGDFYGTTYYGGTGGSGTVFKITSAGVLTTLYFFSAVSNGTNSTAPSGANDDGANPEGALVIGPDGNFYGTTQFGGPTVYGTVFKITAAGTLTSLHNFSAIEGDNEANSDGASPTAGLVTGQDGNLYGVTSIGGMNGDGTVFQITPSGTLTTIHNFSIADNMSENSDGTDPGALIAGPDGNLYGTASGGGANSRGTVFQITLSGTFTTLYTFGTQSYDGTGPDSLIVGPDGNLYGTTAGSGSGGGGTIFKLSLMLDVSPIWTANVVGAGSNGTGCILWNRSDGAMGLWALNSNNVQSAIGPTYGPYAGWTATAAATASDGTSRVLWTNTNGEAGIWTFNAAGVETSEGSVYGPFSGWTAKAVGVAGDGTSRVLWTNVNGEAGVWSFGTNDAETRIGTTYGPITGWKATALATASDGTSRLLWSRSDGAAGVWSLNANDALSVTGSVYGPYSGWTAKAIGAAGDGTSRVLWANTNGAAGVWSFNASDSETVIGTTYGPYSGYGAVALGVSADGTSRVLWNNADRAAGVWTLGTSDAESVIGSVYGPY